MAVAVPAGGTAQVSGLMRASFLGSRWVRIALAVAGATLAWAYVPPMGPRVDLPHLEPFFEPDVPHGKPVFIRSGPHVYYRALLHRPVAPWFSWDYFERMRLRGVQFEEQRSSRSALLFRREGWDIAMAREKALSPYTIEYWKSADGASYSFPVFMRWPWVYVRLSTTVLQTHSAVLVPQEDATNLAVEIPRYPGSVLKSVAFGGESESITLYYLVEAPREDIQRFYSRQLLGMEIDLSRVDPRQAIHLAVRKPFLPPPPPVEAILEMENKLFRDHPLAIYPFDLAEGVPRYIAKHQPQGLTHLPHVSLYRLQIRYRNRAEAEQAARAMTPRPAVAGRAAS